MIKWMPFSDVGRSVIDDVHWMSLITLPSDIAYIDSNLDTPDRPIYMLACVTIYSPTHYPSPSTVFIITDLETKWAFGVRCSPIYNICLNIDMPGVQDVYARFGVLTHLDLLLLEKHLQTHHIMQ